MTAPARFLIVNADDFGQTEGINRGVAVAHERGIVTSASLMVQGEAAAEAARYARRHPDLSVGLHVDLGEWSYRDGGWVPEYEVLTSAAPDEVAAAVERQIEAFHSLTGAAPSHLDSHQHAHRQEPVRSILRGWARRLDVPLRHESPHVRYSGAFYGQSGRGEPCPDAIGVAALLRVLEETHGGWTELGCHPGLGPVRSMYSGERAVEVDTLCAAEVREAVVRLGIQLRSFHQAVEAAA
jgi:predicted glycoside hydrolase/deacetylase ChbG (UPF0249 family)